MGKRKERKDGEDLLEQEWKVSRVIGKRVVEGRLEYRLQWVGWQGSSWEPAENVYCEDLIEQFEERNLRGSVATSSSSLQSQTGASDGGRQNSDEDDNDLKCQLIPKTEPQEQEDERYLLEVASSLVPLKVIGASRRDGVLFVLVKWRNRKTPDFVVASLANVRWPNLVIRYYQQRIRWSQE